MSKPNIHARRKGNVANNVGPAVTWIIPKQDYFIESPGDGYPIFHHKEFSFKAVAPGSGSILWYITCTARTSTRPCPVQGVRNKDGRLLMLRAHNHFEKSAPTRSKRIRVNAKSEAPTEEVKTPPVTPPPVAPSPTKSLTMSNAIRDRWLTLTSSKHKRLDPSRKSLMSDSPCDSDNEISFNESALATEKSAGGGTCLNQPKEAKLNRFKKNVLFNCASTKRHSLVHCKP